MGMDRKVGSRGICVSRCAGSFIALHHSRVPCEEGGVEVVHSGMHARATNTPCFGGSDASECLVPVRRGPWLS